MTGHMVEITDFTSGMKGDEAWAAIRLRDERCLKTSPLLADGVGFAFNCERAKGHDGQHGRTITWMDGDDAVGIVEVHWDAS